MKPTIKYKGKRILWDYNAKNNTYICLYRVLGNNEGITEDEIKTFLTNHYGDMYTTKISDNNGHEKEVHFIITDEDMDISQDYSSSNATGSTQVSTSPINSTLKRAGSEPLKVNRSPRSIIPQSPSFDSAKLFPANSTQLLALAQPEFHRMTTVYLGDKFLLDTETEIEQLSSLLIHTNFSLGSLIERQYSKNVVIEKKSEIMESIKILYDTHLKKFLDLPNERNKEIEIYLRSAIFYDALNAVDSIQEGLRIQDIGSDYERKLLLKANVRTCMSKLYALLDPKVPLADVSQKERIRQFIETSRDNFDSYQQKDDVANMLDKIGDNIVAISVAKYNSSKKTDKFEKSEPVDDFYLNNFYPVDKVLTDIYNKKKVSHKEIPTEKPLLERLIKEVKQIDDKCIPVRVDDDGKFFLTQKLKDNFETLLTNCRFPDKKGAIENLLSTKLKEALLKTINNTKIHNADSALTPSDTKQWQLNPLEIPSHTSTRPTAQTLHTQSNRSLYPGSVSPRQANRSQTSNNSSGFPLRIEELMPSDSSDSLFMITTRALTDDPITEFNTNITRERNYLIQSKTGLLIIAENHSGLEKQIYKNEMMKLIRTLYEEHLMEFARPTDKKHFEDIKLFFQNAVIMAMNHPATMKKGINSSNTKPYQLNSLLDTKARYCLRYLVGLFDESVPVRDMTDNPAVIELIEQSRKNYTHYNQKKSVQELIKNIKAAMLEINRLGNIDDQKEANNEILSVTNDGGHYGFLSARSVIKNALYANKNTNKSNNLIVDRIMMELDLICNNLLGNAGSNSHYIIKPSSEKDDLYLKPQLATELKTLIQNLPAKKLQSHQPDRKRFLTISRKHKRDTDSRKHKRDTEIISSFQSKVEAIIKAQQQEAPDPHKDTIVRPKNMG